MKQSMDQVDPEAAKNISLWLDGCYDEATKDTVRQLVQNNPKEATDAFYTTLSFGTGGMRGTMDVGSNRMNDYTVRAATQGLANYVNKQPAPPEGHSAFIGFDSRHHSKTFAEETAKVFAGNGIRVYLCKDLRPTPLVSFGCRFMHCTTAVMITASHNPPQYNGYKVYWKDGGQVLPPHDIGIIEEVDKVTDPGMVKTVSAIDHPLISLVSDDVDDPYIIECVKLQHYPTENREYGKDLKVVYTSLHGTGITLIEKMLRGWGFPNITYVDKQIIPDGDFPTASYPNPEEKDALALGVETLKAVEGDILVATDPDADRVGIVVRHNGTYVQLDGNKVACILLAHVCEALVNNGKMPAKGAFVKTIVTTELFKTICDAYGKKCVDVLSGFKYIAEEIFRWESDPEGYTYVFGGEDSCGYLLGTQTRDKDGILIAALACEAALHAKRQGKTLLDLLHDLYRKYGVHAEGLLSLKFEESKEGKDQMRVSMEQLRQHLPQQINGVDVSTIDDYQTSLKTDLKSHSTTKITLPVSDVLTFWLVDGTKVVIRPSGTEPKIKLYCGVSEKKALSVEEGEKNCQRKINEILSAMKQLIKG
ncbi:MAG: phospho-sugar mutase [Parachlamydiaceae bacterium]